MLIVTRTINGYEVNQPVTERIFKPLGNTVVRVECENPYYGSRDDLQNEVCTYLTNLMGNGVQVYTHHVTLNSSTEYDSSNKTIILMLEFQILIDAIRFDL